MDAFFTLSIHVVHNSYDVLEVIVAEVQAHPILWNRNTQDYKRSDKKKIVWNAIGQKVGPEGKTIQRRYISLSYKVYTDL